MEREKKKARKTDVRRQDVKSLIVFLQAHLEALRWFANSFGQYLENGENFDLVKFFILYRAISQNGNCSNENNGEGT